MQVAPEILVLIRNWKVIDEKYYILFNWRDRNTPVRICAPFDERQYLIIEKQIVRTIRSRIHNISWVTKLLALEISSTLLRVKGTNIFKICGRVYTIHCSLQEIEVYKSIAWWKVGQSWNFTGDMSTRPFTGWTDGQNWNITGHILNTRSVHPAFTRQELEHHWGYYHVSPPGLSPDEQMARAGISLRIC